MGQKTGRIGSLCTGIGGLDLAVERVYGGQMAWVSEIDSSVLPIIEREWPGVPNLGDIKLIDWAEVEPVDIVTAGYPCQPFSRAGKRQGENDARHLWPYIIEAVRHLRPRRLVLENVQGHLSKGFSAVVQDLAEAGFDAEWCLLRASDVGAPHQRARLFVVATDTCGSGDRGQAGDQAERQDSSRPTGGADRPAAGAAAHAHAEHAPQREGERGGLDSQTSTGEGVSPERQRVRGAADQGCADVAWGQYQPAIDRWERVLGRPAPCPVVGNRLTVEFTEWMMGYPEGWVRGMKRDDGLKALGNAVVPQQGEAAVRLLEDALVKPLPMAMKR